MTTIRFPTLIEVSTSAGDLDGFARHVADVGRSCLIVTGARTSSSTLFSAVVDALADAAVTCEVFSSIVTNPLAEHIEQGAQILRGEKLASVVTVGGGSAHDSGKLMAVLARQEFSIEELTVEESGYSKISEDVAPVFTVPLLAGTGAEISPASLVRLKQQKRIVFSPHMYPRASHYCLPLMFTSDMRLNWLAAFDAYVQSLEAYMSKAATPWSDMFALAGMGSAIEGLVAPWADWSSSGVREKLVYAAIQGLMAVANSSVGAIHALSDPLSGRYGMHHGAALATVAADVLALNHSARPERFETAASLFDKHFGGHFKGEDLGMLVRRLLESGCPGWQSTKPQVDLETEELKVLVSDSRNPDMMGNPASLSDDQILRAYMGSLATQDKRRT